MTTIQFFKYFKYAHSDTYGPGRLDSTKKLLQRHDLIPKYSERFEPEHVAIFLTTAILAPGFRLSRDGDEFVHILKQIITSKENNIYALLKLILTDYSVLRNIENIIIDLSTGTSQINFTWGETQTLYTIQYSYPKTGLRSFAILDQEHLKGIYCRLIQNEQDGGLIKKNFSKIKV